MNYELRIMNRGLMILLIFGLILPGFSFAQNQKILIPATLEEGWLIIQNFFKIFCESFPRILKNIWNNEVLPVWSKMWEWFKINIWMKIEGFFKREIEMRKPVIEEEFKKEKEELKTEIPQVKKSLWERLKELISR